MKSFMCLALFAFNVLGFGCSNQSPDAADLQIDFSWEDMTGCGWGNPEITIGGLPDNTKALFVRMYDHVYMYDHGDVTIAYDGTNVIKKGVLEKIQEPCPPDVPGRYRITIKALDADGVVIGIGKKERYFPEAK